eukprot:2857416-Prymnesium_polylepis.1
MSELVFELILRVCPVPSSPGLESIWTGRGSGALLLNGSLHCASCVGGTPPPHGIWGEGTRRSRRGGGSSLEGWLPSRPLRGVSSRGDAKPGLAKLLASLTSLEESGLTETSVENRREHPLTAPAERLLTTLSCVGEASESLACALIAKTCEHPCVPDFGFSPRIWDSGGVG